MHRSLWVPGSRAEPFFPLCPRRSSWIHYPQDNTALPATGFVAYGLRGITLTRSLRSESPLRGRCSSAFLSVPFVDLVPDNPRRQYRHRRCTRRGGNDSVRCAMSLPKVLLRSVSQPRCSASWPANRLVAGHSRSLRRTDSTEPESVRACSSPTGGDKAAEEENCTSQLSGICVLPLSRSDDKRFLTAELLQATSPRLQDTRDRTMNIL